MIEATHLRSTQCEGVLANTAQVVDAFHDERQLHHGAESSLRRAAGCDHQLVVLLGPATQEDQCVLEGLAFPAICHFETKDCGVERHHALHVVDENSEV